MDTIVMQRLIEVFGSQVAIAEALRIGASTVSMWRKNGIPDGAKWRLLKVARERNLALTAEDLGLQPSSVESGDRKPHDGEQKEREDPQEHKDVVVGGRCFLYEGALARGNST